LRHGPTIADPMRLADPRSSTAALLAGLRARWQGLAAGWLPSPCMLCGGQAERAQLLCRPCAAELPGHRAWRCVQCGLRLALERSHCARCLQEPPAFDATIAALDYAAPVDRALTALKFGGRLAHARAFGDLLAQTWAQQEFDLLTYVPLSAERLRERGFNQSLELARAVGRRLGHRPATLLVKLRDTARQADLAYTDRRANLRQAFACTAALAGRRIAVVDDVMTTGSTLDEAARCLKAAGAAMVLNLVVARTP
jgi:ComF family protein